MIKLNGINKTFFKGKPNEVRAVVNTSLELPEKGLVAICGPSGSGKTTLLNVLGGLEYIDSGEIIYDNVRITKHQRHKLDEIRTQKIGYIFQHYYLLPQYTVYENIELVLHMIGIYDREEIERRITYVLDAVGLLAYRYRKASALSGGQQQRVGIARAIAKDPDIIIADEPTGNLDSNNTIEIMNIIKKISQHKLVVLITHERSLATFYSDQLIEISDGSIISNQPNTPQNSLDIRHHNRIYLKDLQNEPLNNKPVEIQWYKDSATTEQLLEGVKVRLITANDTVYIQVQHESNLKVHYVDERSNIEIYDEHFKTMDMEEVAQSRFDFNELSAAQASINRKKGSAIPAKDAFITAYRKVKNYTKLQKMILLCFFFSAMLIAIAISLFGRQFHITPEQFQVAEQSYISTDAPLSALTDGHESIAFINPVTEKEEFQLQLQSFYQLNMANLTLNTHPSSIELLEQQHIVAGTYPQNNNEVVLDQRVVDTLIEDSQYKQAGIKQAEDLIGAKLYYGFLNIDDPLVIVGIADQATPTLWMEKDFIYKLAIYDIAMSSPFNDALDPNLEPNLALFTDDTSLPERYEELREDRLLLVYSSHITETEQWLQEQQYSAVRLFEDSERQYRNDLKKGYVTILSFAGGLIIIALLQLYFIIRASLVNQIYEIGVYRALGASRWDIYKLFIFEIALLTTYTSLFGYIVMTFIIKELERILPDSLSIFHFPLPLIMIGIIFIYVINIASGLYPVFRLTQKSPSQILKHHDA